MKHPITVYSGSIDCTSPQTIENLIGDLNFRRDEAIEKGADVITVVVEMGQYEEMLLTICGQREENSSEKKNRIRRSRTSEKQTLNQTIKYLESMGYKVTDKK